MQIRDRVRELRRVRASELIPNPRNWRLHPEAQQNALRGAIAEIGFADAAIAIETEDGLMLVDGHLRAEVASDAEIPVLILDLNREEADFLLATLDPLSAMATIDAAKLDDLLADVQTDSDALSAMLDDLQGKRDAEPEAPEDFPTYNEGLETEHSCPRCGYRWSGSVGSASGDGVDVDTGDSDDE